MKTIHDIEELVREYLKRHNMQYRCLTSYNNEITVDTFCYTKLEAKLTKNNRVSFKVDGKRASIYK